MIGWGVSRLLGGDVFGGLWTAFIGSFLNSGAEASRQQQTCVLCWAECPSLR